LTNGVINFRVGLVVHWEGCNSSSQLPCNCIRNRLGEIGTTGSWQLTFAREEVLGDSRNGWQPEDREIALWDTAWHFVAVIGSGNGDRNKRFNCPTASDFLAKYNDYR
jgi:hypothetical protein